MKPPGVEIRKEQRMIIRDVKVYRLAGALARLALLQPRRGGSIGIVAISV